VRGERSQSPFSLLHSFSHFPPSLPPFALPSHAEQPWFWYGFRGVQPTVPHYTGDAFDDARLQTFGVGRSKLFVDLWCVAKTYLRLFDHEPSYPYRIDALAHAGPPESLHAEGPGVALKCLLESATFDFFHRNTTNHTHGDKGLAHHLFDRSSHDYNVFETGLLQPLGYAFTEEEWKEAEVLREGIRKTCSGSTECAGAIDRFNAWLRRTLVLQRRHTHHKGVLEHFELSEPRIEEEFHEVALEMATFLSLNDADLRRLLEYQHEMEWGVRSASIVKEIEGMQADVLGLEEVDRIEDLREKLLRGGGGEGGKEGGLRLAVFKHRKVMPHDDGCALFYNPKVLRLCRLRGEGGWVGGQKEAEEEEEEEEGPPAVAVVRYSGEAEAQQQQRQQVEGTTSNGTGTAKVERGILPLFRSRLPMVGGIVGCEEEEEEEPSGEGQAEGGRKGESDIVTANEKEEIDLWSFSAPETLRRSHQEKWDERVAVVALLQHRATGQLLLAASTHLAHSQDKPAAEAVRVAQVRQLDRALREIRRAWLGEKAKREDEEGEEEAVPTLIMMDGNDTPHLSCYGLHRTKAGEEEEEGCERGEEGGKAYTPMYQAMKEELHYVDCLGEDYGPTSITLNRRYRIDYIWAKVGGEGGERESGGEVCVSGGKEEGKNKVVLEKIEVTPAMDVRLAGANNGDKVLVSREEEAIKAVYGLPLPAIEDQPCIPSDHLHVSAHLTFRVDWPGGGRKDEEEETVKDL